MKKIKLALTLSTLFIFGCASTVQLMDKKSGENLFETNKPVYTLVNLHPDEQRAKLYSVNYQQSGLIPLCSEVVMVEIQPKRLTFKVNSNERQYTLDKHSSSPDFGKYLAQYFGTSCDKNAIAKMSEIDQEGIKKGVVKSGMTKKGVILAIGYPPEHRTPSLDSDEWIYWRNRFATTLIKFTDGVVTQR
ncbi:MAG: hypothetical protein JKY55_07855 [Aliivibrio sp.]|uniref:hypothetical protein n=1 Tax=Aliivibrio sp. TaxID=1872443 RepID=UPI001A4A8EE0|nr:hypothetical protein [Aliivibrio sp.]